MTDLEGRAAVVTGGTRGLGLAIAATLYHRGAEVLLGYCEDEAQAEKALAELPRAHTIRADVSTAEGTGKLLDEAGRLFGTLDFFVHNAVTLHPMPASAPVSDDLGADAAVVLGPLVHGAARLGALLAAPGGRIVAISSTGAQAVIPRYFSLGVAKAGLESVVRYLAVDFARRGITVNALAPGKLDEGPDAPDREIAARVAARTPAGRLTTPDEVAAMVAALCGPDSGALTGQVLTLDGGLGLLA